MHLGDFPPFEYKEEGGSASKGLPKKGLLQIRSLQQSNKQFTSLLPVISNRSETNFLCEKISFQLEVSSSSSMGEFTTSTAVADL